MPVTARLSQKFYERLGEDLAQELVDWFNAVDATYRADLRELNELNFQRFDAKVEQRFAQADAKVEQRLAQLEIKMDSRLSQVEQQLAKLGADLRTEFHAMLTGEVSRVHSTLADQRVSMLRWMFGFWVATLAPLAGLILALQ